MNEMSDDDSDKDNVFMSPHKPKAVKQKKKKKLKSEPRVRKIVRNFEFRIDEKEPSRNNLTLIQGYTGYLKDPVFITMMHVRLFDKLKFFTDRLAHIMMDFDESYEHADPPPFIKQTRTLVIEPLREVYRRIASYEEYTLHALSKEALGAALDIGNDKEVLNIVTKMCKTEMYVGTFTYYFEANTIEYDLFFDKNRQFFEFDNSNADDS
jgi:hypothetical protein